MQCVFERRPIASLIVLVVLVVFSPISSAQITKVFIVPMSHLDIGFTATPREVSEHFRDDLQLGLRVINNLSEAAWNIEALWQLQQWIRTYDREQDRALLKQVARTGRLGLGAFYANMHSSLMTGEELLRALYLAEDLRHQLDAPITSAVMNDVPGFSALVPQALAQSGVRYFLAGVNVEFGGGLDLPVGHMPFYWAGPDGSKVLTWVTTSGKAYLEGVFYWEIHRGLIDVLAEKLQALEKRGYPYDAVLIIDGYGDNAGIEPMIGRLDAIKRLQSNRLGVEVRYSTIDEFFRYMEETYGSTFPTYTGDFGRQWEVVRVGGPWQMARLRSFQQLLPAAEALYTLSGLATSDVENSTSMFSVDVDRPQSEAVQQMLDHAWETMLVLYEHSAAPGTGWPDHVTYAQTLEDNQTKVRYVQDVGRQVEDVLEASWKTLVGASINPSHELNMLVYNPLSWDRGGVVSFALTDVQNGMGCADPIPGIDLVVAPDSLGVTDLITGSDLMDCSGLIIKDAHTDRVIPYQIREGRVSFQTGMVPAMGFKRFGVGRIQDGLELHQALGMMPVNEGHTGHTDPSVAPTPPQESLLSLESPWYRLDIDIQTGLITSIHDKQWDRQLLNQRSRYGFNQLLVGSHASDFLGGVPRPISAVVDTVTPIKRPGATGVNIRYVPGTPWVQTTIWLSSDEKSYDIENELDWNHMRYVTYAEHSDHYYFSFPFNLKTHTLDARYQGAAGFQSLAHDTLPGASANSIISLAAVDLRDDEWGVTVAHKESFAFTVGGTARQGTRFRPPEATLMAHVVQKADEGLTKDRGIVHFDVEPASSGLHTFAFSFMTSEGAFDPISAYRFGLNFVTPMLVHHASHEVPLPFAGQSAVSIDVPGVVVTAFKRPASKQPEQVVLRVQEVSGELRDISIRLAFPVVAATLANGVERPLQAPMDVKDNTIPLQIKPYETMTLLLDTGTPSGPLANLHP